MNRVNVLYFEPSSGYGGSAKCLNELLNNLDKSKFYPILAIFNNGPAIEKIKDLGIEVIKLPYKDVNFKAKKGTIKSYLIFALDIFYNILPTSIRLIALMKRRRINLMHLNTSIISCLSGVIASKLLNIPCVCHIRCTRKSIRREKFFSKWVDTFIVLTYRALKIYQEYLPRRKMRVIYDGLDLNEYVNSANANGVKKEFNLNEDVPIVGIIGRLVEGKGHIDFLRSAAKVIEIRPEVKFMIVGSNPTGDKRLENELKDLTANLSLDRNVIFTGWRNDVPQIVLILDVVVQASTFPEGFGRTCVEAMILRKPVIATNIPGPSEIVEDGNTGFLIPPNDPQALAEAIIKLLNDKELAKSMGKAGKKRAEELFDISKNVKKIEQVYENVLKRKF